MSETTFDEQPPNPGLIAYRIGQLESWRRVIDAWRQDKVDPELGDLAAMHKDIKWIKALLATTATSVVAGSVSITTAILLATGHV